MKRREFLGVIAATTAVAPVTQVGRDAERLRAVLTGTFTTEAGDRDADAWERAVFDYAHEAGYLPPEHVLPEMLADLSELDLLISRATGSARPRLVHADHPEQIVLRLTDEAITISGDVPCAGLAGAYATKAQALAKMGHHTEARDTLDVLRRVFDRLPDHVRDDEDSQLGWSTQRLLHTTSFVHTHRGDHEHARQAQDEALASYTSRSILGPAQVEMYRATTFIQEGDTDAGAQHVMHVLNQHPAAHRKTQTVRRNAITALSKASPKDARRPAVRDAYAMLATTTPS